MPRHFPEFEAFAGMAKQADVVPVYRQLLSDHLTPVTAFELLGRDQQHAMLLESVVGNEKVGRYSFIAAGPTAVYRVKDGKALIQRPSKADVDFETTDPLADLANLLEQRTYYRDKSLPPFTGGLVGYAGYDTIRYYEAEKLPDAPKDDRGLPDLLMGLYQSLVIFDQVDKTIKVVANASVRESDPATAYKRACEQIDAIVDKLQKPPRSKLGEIDAGGGLTLDFQSNLTR
jgi:anthranilate synthase component I